MKPRPSRLAGLDTLKATARARGYSTWAALGAALGCSGGHLAEVAAGRRVCPPDLHRRLCATLGCTPGDLQSFYRPLAAGPRPRKEAAPPD